MDASKSVSSYSPTADTTRSAITVAVRHALLLLLLAVLVLTPTPSVGQQMNLGQVTGTILDPSGHAVADAWITAEHLTT
ncbi:MAG: hypothetical protein AB7O65_00940, partial [Candidatus Korobacteraceae bacterium]